MTIGLDIDGCSIRLKDIANIIIEQSFLVNVLLKGQPLSFWTNLVEKLNHHEEYLILLDWNG